MFSDGWQESQIRERNCPTMRENPSMSRHKHTTLLSCLLAVSLPACSVQSTIGGGRDPSHARQSRVVRADPLFAHQYYFDSMQVLQAWELCKGRADCLIGVVESDADPAHPDYRDNIQEVYRLDAETRPRDARAIRHGTYITGLIAAKDDNGIGIAGLAPECKVILALYGRPPAGTAGSEECDSIMSERAARAIRYAVDKGCKIINCSFKPGPLLQDAFQYAVAQDVVVVLISGNENETMSLGYVPEEVLVVGGIGRNNKRWEDVFSINFRRREGSNYGRSLDVVAPVEDLVLCWPSGSSTNSGRARQQPLWRKPGVSGTSLAAPMATSLCALIRSLRPDLDAESVLHAVTQGADDLGKKGWDEHTGYGRLNFYKSLKMAEAMPRQE